MLLLLAPVISELLYGGIYFIWALGHWSVWAVLLPVEFVDLVNPDRRAETWFGRRGLLRAGLSFCIASFMAWFMWTRRARVRVFHMPPYDPRMVCLLIAVAVIVLFFFLALRLSPSVRIPSERPALIVIRHWSKSRASTNAHRFAAIFGGVLACALSGFIVFAVTGARPIDWIGKFVFDVAAIMWLVSLAGKISTLRVTR